ncbi:MAG: hypothetical protein U1D33_00785, partial [bacterium]|nr:hypothetical protein [bacterium]
MNKIKAQTFDTTAAPVSAEEAQQLKDRIQESLVEIRQAKKWDEYMEMEDRADVEILEAKLKSSLAVINQFLATGEWSAPAGTGETTSSTTGQIYNPDPGWKNGPVTVRNDIRSDMGLVEGAEYAGSVYIEEDPAQRSVIDFKLSDTTTDFRAYNRGRDIIYVETYKDAQGALQKRYWVGKNHVTDVRADIRISAHDLDHGVTIDMSRTYRISDGSHGIEYGTVAGFNIAGSDGYDTIYGSQGNDYILGLKGNDKIYGMAGKDILYGDDDPGMAAAREQGAYGLRKDLEDGDDILDGGAGLDDIYGGGGRDYGFETDAASERHGIEEPVSSQNSPLSANAVINTSETRGWEVARSRDPNVIEIRETDTSGNSVLSLGMPSWAEMAFAEEQGNDLKITYVGATGNGPPRTAVVIVRGALAPREG